MLSQILILDKSLTDSQKEAMVDLYTILLDAKEFGEKYHAQGRLKTVLHKVTGKMDAKSSKLKVS